MHTTNRRSLNYLFLAACVVQISLAAVEIPDMGSNILDGVKEGLGKLEHTFGDIIESVEDLLEQSTIAGQISPLIKKVIPSMAELKGIWNAMKQVVSASDLVLLFAVSFFLIPALQIPYNQMDQTLVKSRDLADTRSFRETRAYYVANLLSQVAKLALVVYVVDMVKIFLVGVGFNIPRNDRITHAFSYVIYTMWASVQLSLFKRGILTSQVGSSRGRVQVVDRLVDAALYGCTTFIIMDILNVQLGLALQSVLALGSVSTLVFSFASQGIAKQLLHGILLMASDRIYEGDMILLGKSGFSGRVANLGWIETIIRGSDEVMVTIPNSDLLSERVSNLSRLHKCQVKQTLKFSRSESEQLPKLLLDIKTEIRRRCPTVITDGSRPFRATWTNFAGSSLEVVVDAHFRISPAGDMFWDNRQRCMQAIDEAVRINGMTLL